MITDNLIVLRNEASALIRDEIRAASQRAVLEAAVRDAVTKLGCSVDEVSAETGLTPKAIYKIIDTPEPIEDELERMMGLC